MNTKKELREMVTRKTCRWCDSELPLAVGSYDHSGGYVVENYQEPQWCFITCKSCGYDWSLWKLGAPNPQELSSADQVPK